MFTRRKDRFTTELRKWDNLPVLCRGRFFDFTDTEELYQYLSTHVVELL